MRNKALLARLERLVSVGIDLSGQKDVNRILARILDAAMTLTGADGGTLYLVEGGSLHFALSRNTSLGFLLGGPHGDGLSVEPIPLNRPDGMPNLSTVATAAANQRSTINLADAYAAAEFDFSGTRRFDAQDSYRSQSFLTVPLVNHEDAVIGVLQLINALDVASGTIVEFDRDDQYLVEALASQAAVVLNNRQLIDRLEALFFAFIKVINIALDEKSPYTHGHCQRVPPLTMLLAEAASRSGAGPLKDFTLTDAMRHELELAALMHDCGKITTPVHVVDKATKLEAIHDRIQLVDTRFEVLKRDARIGLLEAGLAGPGLEARYRVICAQLDAERDMLRRANIGGETMSEAEIARIRAIAVRHRWQAPSGETVALLSDEELDKLCIARGTLSADGRAIINHHIDATLRMLEALPWPKHLSRVPEYAGGHHERMDGKGYPRGLTREQMSVPARIMAIADVFEALTARDRPYKPGKPLSEALAILGRMKLDQHIDPDLFDVFIREKICMQYAERYLDPAQVDDPDETQIPGYNP